MKSPSHSFPAWLKWSGTGLLLMLSCTHAQYRLDYSPHDACALLDSLYYSALLPMPYSISGKARFDVNQYRLRGAFVLKVHSQAPPVDASAAAPPEVPGNTGNMNRSATQVFDFVSSSYFGSHREDITISMTDGETRILDRERGAYYEGEDADRFIRERLDISGNFSEVIGIATGSAPACGIFRQAAAHTTSRGDIAIGGQVGSERASFLFGAPDRKLKEIKWPFEVQPGTIEELRITYEWSDGGESLESILLILESLNWQIKLAVSEMIQQGPFDSPLRQE